MDALEEFILNTVMTLAARVGNVLGVYAGGRVFRRQGIVRGVTARAGGGNDQSAFKQSPAMNAFGVTGDDAREFGGQSSRGLLACPVAASA